MAELKLTDRLLLVFAHPDDETFICGGMVAKYAKAGIPITLVCATKGEEGRRMGQPPFTDREGLPKVREEELRRACHILGIEDFRFLGIRDKSVGAQDRQQLAGRITAIMEELRPQTVVTFTEYSRYSGHPDHLAMALAAKLAFENWTRGSTGEIPRLYGVLSAGDAGNPAAIHAVSEQIAKVNVQDTLQEKMEAFRAHRSQSEQETWVWRPDREVLRRFSNYEYFLKLSTPYQAGETELLNWK